jgi:hypothetical protein
MHCFEDIGIRVDRPDYLHVRVPFGQARNGAANAHQRLTVVFAAVSRHQHRPEAAVKTGKLVSRDATGVFSCHLERINDRITWSISSAFVESKRIATPPAGFLEVCMSYAITGLPHAIASRTEMPPAS